MINLSLSKEEIVALLSLMDAGVKALGRPAAKACAVLDDKITAAVNASKVTPLKSVENAQAE